MRLDFLAGLRHTEWVTSTAGLVLKGWLSLSFGGKGHIQPNSQNKWWLGRWPVGQSQARGADSVRGGEGGETESKSRQP